MLLTATAHMIGSDGQAVKARVLFDSGADRTFISKSLVKKASPTWEGSVYMRYAAFGGRKGHGVYGVFKVNVTASILCPQCIKWRHFAYPSSAHHCSAHESQWNSWTTSCTCLWETATSLTTCTLTSWWDRTNTGHWSAQVYCDDSQTPHSAFDPAFPTLQREKDIVSIKVNERVTFREARER